MWDIFSYKVKTMGLKNLEYDYSWKMKKNWFLNDLSGMLWKYQLKGLSIVSGRGWITKMLQNRLLVVNNTTCQAVSKNGLVIAAQLPFSHAITGGQKSPTVLSTGLVKCRSDISTWTLSSWCKNSHLSGPYCFCRGVHAHVMFLRCLQCMFYQCSGILGTLCTFIWTSLHVSSQNECGGHSLMWY